MFNLSKFASGTPSFYPPVVTHKRGATGRKIHNTVMSKTPSGNPFFSSHKRVKVLRKVLFIGLDM